MHPQGQPLAGRYALDRPLAAGGMSEVWRATDLVLNRPVAVKIIRPGLLAQPDFAQRFAAEARILAGLRHPGIVAVYDYGEAVGPAGPTAYLVMEFIDGEPLSDRLAREHQLSPAETMAIVAQAADALQTAHQAGVVHRDIKPANLLVRPDGTVVVVDFGVAKAELSSGLTQTDMMLGTARYMAPEQVNGHQIGPATDQYALGVVAYECLAGAPPFDADTPIAIALKHVSEEPALLPDSIPGRVRAIVARAMAKDPAERFADAAALAAAARVAQSEPDALAATAPLPVVRRSPAGRYAMISGAGVAVAAISAILLALGLPTGDSPPAQPLPAPNSTTTTGTPLPRPIPQTTLQRRTGSPAASRPPVSASPDASAVPQSSPTQAPPPSDSPQPAPSTSTAAVTTPSPAASGQPVIGAPDPSAYLAPDQASGP